MRTGGLQVLTANLSPVDEVGFRADGPENTVGWSVTVPQIGPGHQQYWLNDAACPSTSSKKMHISLLLASLYHELGQKTCSSLAAVFFGSGPPSRTLFGSLLGRLFRRLRV